MAQQGQNEIYAKPNQVLFIVGKDRIRCVGVRGLLAISSPIFRKMLNENKETGNEIELPHINAESFEIVLSHISGTNIKNKINHKNMCNVLHISVQYMLPKLTQITTKFVKKSLHKSNIFELYQVAQAFDDDNLKEILWNWIGKKSIKVTDPIINNIFLSLNDEQIAILLQKDYISINEERIFAYCLNWIKAQYQKNDTNPMLTARDLMHNFIKYIRFPLMTHTFITTDVYFTGILTNDEIINIYRAKTLHDQKLTLFNIQIRKAFKRRIKVPVTNGNNTTARSGIGSWLNHLMNNQNVNNNSNDHQIEDEEEESDDDEFDSVNMEQSDYDDEDKDEDKEEDDDDIEDVTDKIRAISCSSEYSTQFRVNNIYNDDASYWASTELQRNKDEYIIFDCVSYNICKVSIKFPVEEGACSIVKVYSTDDKDNLRNPKLGEWNKITKKINMPKSGTGVQNVKIINDDLCRYLLFKFEDGMNGYAGVQRIRFYAKNEDPELSIK